MAIDRITVRGARQHNLKNINVEIPRDRFTVITGLSGSGKSSLAFDTIYAEGQRRYVESLSAYARQFLERMEKPDVDRIDGISPAIAIRQKNSIRNPRSTVGTTTEIHDYMRLLFARVGWTFCRSCGRQVVRETAEVVARQLGELPAGTRLLLGGAEGPQEVDELSEASFAAFEEVPDEANPADSTNASAAAIAATVENLRRKGFGRLLFDDRATPFDDVNPAALAGRGTLQVVVDRVQLGDEDQRRRLGGGSGPDRGGARAARRSPLLRALRVPSVWHHLRGSAAEAVLVQQPVRRVSDLPRVRQHHRARHGPGRARSVEVDRAERHRALEQAALPRAAGGSETRRKEDRAPARHALVRADPGRAAVRRRRRGRLRRHPRVLPVARTQEIQGPRARVPQPVPRLPAVPGLRGRPP